MSGILSEDILVQGPFAVLNVYALTYEIPTDCMSAFFFKGWIRNLIVTQVGLSFRMKWGTNAINSVDIKTRIEVLRQNLFVVSWTSECFKSCSLVSANPLDQALSIPE